MGLEEVGSLTTQFDIVITPLNIPGAASILLKQWANVSDVSEHEVTTQPSAVGGTLSLVRRATPAQVMGKLIIADNRSSDERTLAREGAPAFLSAMRRIGTVATTREYLRMRCEELRDLRGSLIHFYSRSIELVGYLQKIAVTDSGEWDNMVEAEFEIREVLEATAGKDSNIFGTITIPFTAPVAGVVDCFEGSVDTAYFSIDEAMRNLDAAFQGATGLDADGIGNRYGGGLYTNNDIGVSIFGSKKLRDSDGDPLSKQEKEFYDAYVDAQDRLEALRDAADDAYEQELGRLSEIVGSDKTGDIVEEFGQVGGGLFGGRILSDEERAEFIRALREEAKLVVAGKEKDAMKVSDAVRAFAVITTPKAGDCIQ